MSSSEIVKQWVTAINGHEVTALTALMAVDHVFVDSLGSWLPARLEGR
jgi:ketosteroid isomerase-like protein